MGDERGDAVVVAVADLVLGNGVVLVDDRHAAQLEQAGEGLAGVQVLLTVGEVVRYEQHLRPDADRGGRVRGCTASISRG